MAGIMTNCGHELGKILVGIVAEILQYSVAIAMAIF
jgi:hypothetical protein